MGGRTDKRTGPNLPADTDVDDLDDQDGDEAEDEEASGKPGPGKREAKYRKRARAAEGELRAVRAELDQLKAQGDSGKADELTEVAEELAFVKAAAAAGVSDIEAAWRLCDRKLLRWESEDQDGQEGHDRPHELAGVDEALEKVLDRYPYVASSKERGSVDGVRRDDDRVQPPTAMTTGRPTNGPKNKPNSPLLDRAYLERKYPSLRRRGSRSPF